MGKLTIQDIAKTLMERNDLSKKEASAFVNVMFETIKQALERDRIVKVKGLGTFKIIDVDARESVNVNTGERVLIEGHDKITFVPDPLMKELVNKPFSQFETVVLKDGVDFEDMEGKENGEDTTSVPLVEFGDSINLKPVILGEPKPQPVPEPSPEPEPEPVPAPEPEPQLAPELVSAPEPTPEPESLLESDPAPAKEELVGEEPAEEPLADETTEDEIVEDQELLYEEDESPYAKKWVIALIACLLGLVAGYFIGSYYPFSQFVPPSDVKEVKTEVSKPVKKVVVAPVKPEIKQEAPESEAKSEAPASEVKSETKPEVKLDSPKPVESKPATEPVVDKYAAMDVRVRTGAYKIIGTDRVITAKEGETLAKIARSVLGPDMECYLEVYNGLKASSVLKAGQEIKIPKLQLKKKKKPQTVNE